MDYLSSNKIGIIDLTTMTVTDEEIDDDLIGERIGGVGITTYLYEKFKDDDPVVLGTGMLTGTLVPGSSLGVITAKSPLTGNVCHAPFSLYIGMEMKYSGFDYLVIKGDARKPVYLWLHDGIADIGNAGELWGKSSWETVDALRNNLGDDLIQLLTIGKAGEEEFDHAQILANYWPSGDRWGFGKLFGRKKLKAIAMRGMGLLELADFKLIKRSPGRFVNVCAKLMDEIKKEPFMKKKGCTEFPAAVGEEDIKEWVAPLVHRHSSCFNCPYPTNTFVMLDEDVHVLKESGVEEPGFLITDIYGLIGFKKIGLSAEDSCRMLKLCAKYGIDAVAVAEQCKNEGKTGFNEIKASIPDLKGAVINPGNGRFSPWSPPKPLFADFGLPADGSRDAGWWQRRQAVAYIFGIHPIFALMSTELSEEKLISLVNIGTGLIVTPEILDKIVADVLQ